jgi:hypothetical protein
VEPEWGSRAEPERHFGLHGRDVGARTVAEYEASSREVIETGTAFQYGDFGSDQWRLGYYDRVTERFTAVTEDGARIATHFRCPEYYVDRLAGSTYA